jgi:hypothetical protein
MALTQAIYRCDLALETGNYLEQMSGDLISAFYLALAKVNMTKSAPSVDGSYIVKPWDSRSDGHCAQVGEPYLHDGGTSTPALAPLAIMLKTNWLP